jgi:hypothetical protein
MSEKRTKVEAGVVYAPDEIWVKCVCGEEIEKGYTRINAIIECPKCHRKYRILGYKVEIEEISRAGEGK